MSESLVVTPAARITARLDRLPMTKHIWVLVLLISLGGWFDVYSLFLTGYIAPGLFADNIFTPTTKGFFDVNGLAFFIASLFAGLFIGALFLTRFADKEMPSQFVGTYQVFNPGSNTAHYALVLATWAAEAAERALRAAGASV